MSRNRNDDRSDDVDGDVPGRHDVEPRRRRLAVLIGRLIARDWLRTRAAGEVHAREDSEARP